MKTFTPTILLILLIGCTPFLPKPIPPAGIVKTSATAPSPQETMADPAAHWTVCVPALNVRVGPDPEYIQTGGVFQGDILTIYAIDGQWGRIDPVEDMWVWLPCLCPPEGDNHDTAQILVSHR